MLAPRKTLHSTPLCVFRRALELVAAHPGDVLYDLGCGDGRLVIEAAKVARIRAVGVEIDADRCEAARRSAEREGVTHLVTFVCANALEFELPADATIVFLFLIDRGLSLMKSRLERAAQRSAVGLRLVTYLYRVPGVVPSEKHFVPAKEGSLGADVAFPLFVYRFPLVPIVSSSDNANGFRAGRSTLDEAESCELKQISA